MSKLQCTCKKQLSLSQPPYAPDASENHVMQGSSLGSEGGFDSPRAAASGSSSTGQTGGSISSMSFKRQATLPEGQLQSWEETQALPSRRSSGERAGLHMNRTYEYMRMCIKTKERMYVHLYQVCLRGLYAHKEGVMCSMQACLADAL